VTNNHKNIILDRSGKAKLGQRVRACDDQIFCPLVGGRRSVSSGNLVPRERTAVTLLKINSIN
jgi:hypothetical protein